MSVETADAWLIGPNLTRTDVSIQRGHTGNKPRHSGNVMFLHIWSPLQTNLTYRRREFDENPSLMSWLQHVAARTAWRLYQYPVHPNMWADRT